MHQQRMQDSKRGGSRDDDDYTDSPSPVSEYSSDSPLPRLFKGRKLEEKRWPIMGKRVAQRNKRRSKPKHKPRMRMHREAFDDSLEDYPKSKRAMDKFKEELYSTYEDVNDEEDKMLFYRDMNEDVEEDSNQSISTPESLHVTRDDITQQNSYSTDAELIFSSDGNSHSEASPETSPQIAIPNPIILPAEEMAEQQACAQKRLAN